MDHILIIIMLSSYYTHSLQPTYQKLIQSEGMVEHLVKGLKTKNTELQKHCASAIFKVIYNYNRCMVNNFQNAN